MDDLLLRGGHIIDPMQAIDMVGDIAFAAGKVAAIGEDLSERQASEIRDASGLMVVPGLIDIHAHVYWGGTFLGVPAEPIARRSGTTTFIDAGTAGAGTYSGFRDFIIKPAPVRILAYLNISHAGIFGYGPGFMIGETADLRMLPPGPCVAVARENLDTIVGVKVRLGGNVSAYAGLGALDCALDAAEELDLPMMVHIGPTPPRRKDILARMRPGDILTHCCRMFPNQAIDRNRNLRAEVLEARERGVIFDVGHGRGSFDFDVASAMLEHGFLPDVISSDVHVQSQDGPAYDVLVTMSKFRSLGMAMVEVVRAVTENPAKAVGHPELGSLAVGTPGDATVLREETGAFPYKDSLNKIMTGARRLRMEGTIVAGSWWCDGADPADS